MESSEIGNIHPYRDVPREGTFKWSIMNVVILPTLFVLKIGFTVFLAYSGFLFFRDVVWYHDFDAKKEAGNLALCERNLKVMAQGLEHYHEAHGEYPQNQYQLVPQYLQDIPSCPASGRQGYRTDFFLSDKGVSGRQSFVIYCADNQHHRKITEFMPQWKGSQK